MATYLLCATPVYGHVAPLLRIGEHLAGQGHRVILLTGSRFAVEVIRRGLEFRPLTGIADYDDRDVAGYLPDRERYRGLARAQYEIQTMFVRTIPEQHRSIRRILDDERVDAILVDSAFGGVGPLLAGAREGRPPILAVGVTPLAQSSRDVAPFGMALAPTSTPLGRLRNHALNLLASRVLFRQTQRIGERMYAEVAAPAPTDGIMDISRTLDRFLVLTVPEFEYPRSDLAPNTRFVGPVLPRPADAALPEWWGELDGARPVVYVTQGTVDNRDLDRLIRPTVAGLARNDVLVVVSTGGRPVTDAGALPSNVRIAEFLPHHELLPFVDVFVTNGGFGGVQFALSHGVPIVVAGDSEEKPEVAARIGWSGVGVNLKTGTPTAPAVRNAVEAVLEEPGYRERAARLAESLAGCSALDTIERELEEAVSLRVR